MPAFHLVDPTNTDRNAILSIQTVLSKAEALTSLKQTLHPNNSMHIECVQFYARPNSTDRLAIFVTFRTSEEALKALQVIRKNSIHYHTMGAQLVASQQQSGYRLLRDLTLPTRPFSEFRVIIEGEDTQKEYPSLSRALPDSIAQNFAVLNVHGFIDRDELEDALRQRVTLRIPIVCLQIWRARSSQALHAYVTFLSRSHAQWAASQLHGRRGIHKWSVQPPRSHDLDWCARPPTPEERTAMRMNSLGLTSPPPMGESIEGEASYHSTRPFESTQLIPPISASICPSKLFFSPTAVIIPFFSTLFPPLSQTVSNKNPQSGTASSDAEYLGDSHAFIGSKRWQGKDLIPEGPCHPNSLINQKTDLPPHHISSSYYTGVKIGLTIPLHSNVPELRLDPPTPTRASLAMNRTQSLPLSNHSHQGLVDQGTGGTSRRPDEPIRRTSLFAQDDDMPADTQERSKLAPVLTLSPLPPSASHRNPTYAQSSSATQFSNRCDEASPQWAQHAIGTAHYPPQAMMEPNLSMEIEGPTEFILDELGPSVSSGSRIYPESNDCLGGDRNENSEELIVSTQLYPSELILQYTGSQTETRCEAVVARPRRLFRRFTDSVTSLRSSFLPDSGWPHTRSGSVSNGPLRGHQTFLPRFNPFKDDDNDNFALPAPASMQVVGGTAVPLGDDYPNSEQSFPQRDRPPSLSFSSALSKLNERSASDRASSGIEAKAQHFPLSPTTQTIACVGYPHPRSEFRHPESNPPACSSSYSRQTAQCDGILRQNSGARSPEFREHLEAGATHIHDHNVLQGNQAAERADVGDVHLSELDLALPTRLLNSPKTGAELKSKNEVSPLEERLNTLSLSDRVKRRR